MTLILFFKKRSSTIVIRMLTVVIEISKKMLAGLLLTTNLDLHKTFKGSAKEFNKKKQKHFPIFNTKLSEMIKNKKEIIRLPALQLQSRL